MKYSGSYAGTINTYCDQFNYTDPISIVIDDAGNVILPGFDQGALQGGRIDDAGNVTGASITVNSLSLGSLKIPYSGNDDGAHLALSGISVNGIRSVIQASLVAPPPVVQPPPVTVFDNGDGTHTIVGSTDGLTLHSIANDLMIGGGVAETFVFTPGFGQNEITDFVVGGQDHDTIDLSETHYHTLAQVLRHTTMSDGSATIHLNPNDAITLDGVTKAQLRAHPGDFVLA